MNDKGLRGRAIIQTRKNLPANERLTMWLNDRIIKLSPQQKEYVRLAEEYLANVDDGEYARSSEYASSAKR